MSRAKWDEAGLMPPDGYLLLPGHSEARRYRGLLIYPSYDIEEGFVLSSEWEVEHEASGEMLLFIRANEERAYEIATRLAEMLNWREISVVEWTSMSRDPAFLAFMAEHYQEVAIPLPASGPLDDPDLERIVPFGDEVLPGVRFL